MDIRYLYRGVSARLHDQSHGILYPKLIGAPFERDVFFGEKVYFGGGALYGRSERNAVVMHQQDSSEYETSGVSTTPIYERALFYATHDGKYQHGFIYKIDTTLFSEFEVSTHTVKDHAKWPKVPEDDEVILVAKENGPLPSEIIVEVICI